MLDTLEVVIPAESIAWDHEESLESITQQHLDLLEATGGVILRVCHTARNVFALFSPLESMFGDAVRCERARPLCK